MQYLLWYCGKLLLFICFFKGTRPVFFPHSSLKVNHIVHNQLICNISAVDRALEKRRNMSVWSLVVWTEKRRPHAALFISPAGRPWKNTAQMRRRKTKHRTQRKTFCPPKTQYVFDPSVHPFCHHLLTLMSFQTCNVVCFLYNENIRIRVEYNFYFFFFLSPSWLGAHMSGFRCGEQLHPLYLVSLIQNQKLGL